MCRGGVHNVSSGDGRIRCSGSIVLDLKFHRLPVLRLLYAHTRELDGSLYNTLPRFCATNGETPRITAIGFQR